MEVRKLVRVHAQLGGHDLLCDWTTAVCSKTFGEMPLD
jgi:hypothetical protein